MKNTLTINHLNSGSVDLVNRVNSGTNEFLLEVTGGRGATITFDGGNAVSVTSDDFIYSVSSSLWVGSNSLSINISDGTISYTLTVNKIDQLTGDIYIQKDSETEFTLVRATGGGGSGGTNDYNDLTNKPQIEGIVLQGNKNYEDLNLQRISNTELEELLTL